MIGSGNWGQKTGGAFLLPSLLGPDQLSPAASLHRGPALRRKFTVELAECHGSLGPARPCVSVFTGRLLCPGSWTPEGQEVAGEAMQGLSRHLGVMGSPSEKRLAGDRARWGWGGCVSSVTSGSNPAGSAMLPLTPGPSHGSPLYLKHLFNQLGLAGSL